MLLTYQETLVEFGSRHHVRKALTDGRIHLVTRGIYSTDPEEDSLAIVMKLYPNAIVTGQTALYFHGLITAAPERIDLATKRRGTKISNYSVRQHFVPESWLAIGVTKIAIDGIHVTVYDRERMLLELMRSRKKIPYDLYREAVASFRLISDRLDIYKLQDYAAAMPRGESYLSRAIQEVF